VEKWLDAKETIMKLKLSLLATVILAASPLALSLGPIVPSAYAQRSLGANDDSDNDRVLCMNENAVKRLVNAKGYSNVTFGNHRDEYWKMTAAKDGSPYVLVVNTCAGRIVTHQKLAAR
jgi:hypothetical protein